jgi:SET domain
MLLPLVRAVCPATVSTVPLMNVFDAIPLKPANVLRRRSRIAVRRPVHGRGVFATRALAPGELICEYLGERIAWDEAVLRHPRDPAHPDHTFYFDVGDGTVIDGAVGGNSARWINHACSPNCEAEDRDGRIFIRTVHPVPAGEELSIDYARTTHVAAQLSSDNEPDGRVTSDFLDVSSGVRGWPAIVRRGPLLRSLNSRLKPNDTKLGTQARYAEYWFLELSAQ